MAFKTLTRRFRNNEITIHLDGVHARVIREIDLGQGNSTKWVKRDRVMFRDKAPEAVISTTAYRSYLTFWL